MIRRMFGASRGIGRAGCALARRATTPPAEASSSVIASRRVIMARSLGDVPIGMLRQNAAFDHRAEDRDIERLRKERADSFVHRLRQLRTAIGADDDHRNRE